MLFLTTKPGAKGPGGARKANPARTASAKARQAMTLTHRSAAAKAEINFLATARVTVSLATSSRGMT